MSRGKLIGVIALSLVGLYLVGEITQPISTALNGVSHGLGSTNATGDVDKIRVDTTPDAIGFKQGFVQVTNHSSGTSDYSIKLRVLGATGVNLGMANATAHAVAPGQTAKAKFMLTDDSADRVEITEIQRTASS
jgi:hypothetical protein